MCKLKNRFCSTKFQRCHHTSNKLGASWGEKQQAVNCSHFKMQEQWYWTPCFTCHFIYTVHSTICNWWEYDAVSSAAHLNFVDSPTLVQKFEQTKLFLLHLFALVAAVMKELHSYESFIGSFLFFFMVHLLSSFLYGIGCAMTTLHSSVLRWFCIYSLAEYTSSVPS